MEEVPHELIDKTEVPSQGSQDTHLRVLMLKLKLQYFGHLMRRADSLEKTLMLGKMKAGGEGDDRGWESWMASLTQWTWFWANSGRWWRTERPVVLWFMGLQKVEHNWATEQQQRSQGLDRSLGGIISVRQFNLGLVLNSRNSKLHLSEIDYALGCRLKLNKLIRDWCVNHIYFH